MRGVRFQNAGVRMMQGVDGVDEMDEMDEAEADARRANLVIPQPTAQRPKPTLASPAACRRK